MVGRYVLVASAAFLFGVVLGWKLHEWRLQYLKRKRDYYARKAVEIHNEMEQ